MKYIHPDYNSLKPKKIRRILNDLAQSNNSNYKNYTITPEQLLSYSNQRISDNPKLIKYALRYLNDKKILSRKNELLKILISYISKNPKSFNRFYKQLFYRYLENMTDEHIKEFLIENQNKIKGSFKKYFYPNGKILLGDKYSGIISEYLVFHLMKNHTNSIVDIESNFLFSEYKLHSNYRAYNKIILEYLFKAINLKVFFDDSSHFIDIMGNISNSEEIKKIIERIIVRIPASGHSKKRYKVWIDYINSKLGSPFSETKHKWIGISEEVKRKFNHWIMIDEIYRFFDINDPSQRAPFWQRYSHEFSNIHYIAEVNKAVLMFTYQNHLMVEFLATSNASYIFKLNNQDEYLQLLNRLKYSVHWEQIALLKGDGNLKPVRNLPHLSHRGGWIHSGSWSWNFRDNLRTLGYSERE